MESKYLKDFVIALVFIMLFVFGVRDYNFYKKAEAVSEESKYKNLALDDVLLKRIQEIETSIQDRKMFVFTVVKDPLEQNLIVKTQVDLQKQWEEMVASMMRLAATFVDSRGAKRAYISYAGKNWDVKAGDQIGDRKIVEIQQGRVYFTQGGMKGFIDVQPIPAKPASLDENKAANQYNW